MQQPLRIEAVVTFGVLRRVVDQHQVRLALWFARQRGEIEVSPDVAVHDQERGVAQHR